jgi:hypothetical protein
MCAMSVNETANLVTQSHSVMIYDGHGEHSVDDISQTMGSESKITLNSIHSLLIQMNSKLNNIELKNNSLEIRLGEIENKITGISDLQNTVTTVRSHVEK